MAHFLDALGGAMVDPACPLDWSHPLNQGLVADYTIIPNPGWRGGLTLRDLVRGGRNPHDGTRVAGPVWQGASPGAGYGSLLFASASSQYVDLGANVPLSTAGSLACWVFITSNPGTAVSLFGFGSGGNGNNLQIDIKDTFGSGSNRIQIFGEPSGTNNVIQSTGARLVTLNAWHHIVVTADGSAWAIYLDGQACALETGGTGSNIGVWTGGITTSGTVKSAIGTRWIFGGAAQYMNGGLAGHQLYNRAITAQEVSALYAETKLGNPNRFRWLGRRSYSFPSTSPPPPPASQQTFMLMGIGG